MQDDPKAQSLLAEIARFLETRVRPALDDRGLGFRVRIAEHLLGMVAREIDAGTAYLDAEAERLAGLLGTTAPQLDRAAWVGKKNAELAEGLRADSYDADTRAAIAEHLMQTLRETLTVAQPRFDTRLHPDAAKPAR